MLVVLLSPPGRGALAILHVAGEGSVALVERLLGKAFGEVPVHGWLRQNGERLDEVLVRRVSGFSAEPTVEISSHGGSATVERLLAAFEAEGVPRAESAALLDRAVATRALDRLQAEAWALLPGVTTLRAARMLQDQAEGALSRAVAALKSPGEAGPLLETAGLGRALVSPRRLTLVGLPNAGKSTLFNALLDMERALVSPEAGTTRDPVREGFEIDGIPFELVDTAGVEAPRDGIAAEALQRTLGESLVADLVLFVSDASVPDTPEERALWDSFAGRARLRVANKCDVGGRVPEGARPLSGLTGAGLGDLRQAVLQELGLRKSLPAGAPVLFTARQERLLREGDLERLRFGPRE